MPKIDDHPLRLARIRAGVRPKQLADGIGVHRSTVAAIEEGRTNEPSPETVQAIESFLNLPPGRLQEDLARWQVKRAESGPQLTLRGKALLMASPETVAEFPSFVHWRSMLSPSPTSFASMLGVNRVVVANYERGIRLRGMPDTLSHALVSVLGISNDYLLALQRLEPSDD